MITFITVFMKVYGTFLLSIFLWFLFQVSTKVFQPFDKPENIQVEGSKITKDGFWESIAMQLKEVK